MRKHIMIALLIVILAALNFGIYQNNQITQHGETVLFELAPVDPRSLMQGDYMRLAYAVERAGPKRKHSRKKTRKTMVIRVGEDKVAQFVRDHNGEALDEGEKLLDFIESYGRARIVPNSLFFQEGHAEHYEEAKYGVFKFHTSGKHLLIGLANEDKKQILVEPPK